ncbi:MAG: (2Fe-2S)-binding protein [Planctomycetota bacterium]
MYVDRCVCHDVSLEEILRIARADGLDLAQVAARTGCTTGCGMCRPYVRLTLATGRVRWPLMSGATAERELERLAQEADEPVRKSADSLPFGAESDTL